MAQWLPTPVGAVAPGRPGRYLPVTLIRTTLTGAVGASLTLALAMPADAAVPPPPKPTVAMPSAVDVPMNYQGQTLCSQNTKPGVAAWASIVATNYKRPTYGTIRPCASDVSEHYDGRALDWMLNVNNAEDKAIADAVTTWLTVRDGNGNYGAWARRLGIMYIIWNKKTWKSYRDINTWTTYTGSVPHTDHIHFSFAWDGACKRTSWWTGRAATAINPATCQAGPSVTVDTEFTKLKDLLLKLGSTGDAVRVAQANLPGVSVDGQFGPQTQAAVKAFQTKYGLKVNGFVARPVWNKMEQLQYPLIKYRKTVILKRGSTGDAVKAAQWALRLPQDGVFGLTTFRAVKKVEAKYGITVNGVIGPLTWAALDEELRSRMREEEAGRELGKVIAQAKSDYAAVSSAG